MKQFMKRTAAIFLLIISFANHLQAQAQKVVYTEPDRDEPKETNFEIIGKYNGHFLVFKNYRGNTHVSVYDTDMKLVDDVKLPFINDRLIETDFVTYPDFSFLFYQYQRKNVVYAMMVKLGPTGKNLSEPIELDTTHVGISNSGSRIYSVLASEDKKSILVFKVNSRNEKRYSVKTLLYSSDMDLKHASTLQLNMNDRNDFLTDFYLDNDGNLVFGRGIRPGLSDNINKFFLVIKPAAADSFAFKEFVLQGITLDEVKLRMDNYNNRYLFTGFYYKGKRTNSIEGICNAIYSKAGAEWEIKNVIPLGDELRSDAKGENNIKNAFDDYYIKQIIIRKDGGFVIAAESVYETTRGNPYNNFNRWGNMYSPFYSSYDYYRFGGYSPYGFNRWGNNSNYVRYHADNIVVLDFDKDGKMVLSNTIRKSQFDDDTEANVSYQMINSGIELMFLYNDYDKRDPLLSYQSINAEGKVSRLPTLKNMDKGFTFMPRFGKQTGSRQSIVPCLYRNSLCFAKLDL